jgi:serine/threonine protein kinase
MHTQSGVLLGTFRYMAPEQVDRKFGEISPRTDVWALGAVMYEMLTGQPAVPKEGAMNIFAYILQEEIVPPSKLGVAVSSPVEEICLKAMAKEPARRFASARELAAEIRKVLTPRPQAKRRTQQLKRQASANIVYRMKKWVKQHPVPVAIAGVVVLLFSCAFILYVKIQAKKHEIMTARQKVNVADAKKPGVEDEPTSLFWLIFLTVQHPLPVADEPTGG